MSKFTILLPTWNDIEWIKAAIEQALYWNPDRLIISEGCWDNKYPSKSTDGTSKFLVDYMRERLIDYLNTGQSSTEISLRSNLRDWDYSINQYKQCQLATLGAKPGDFIMYQASDMFLFKKDIDEYKEAMANEDFDYPIFKMRCFWESPHKYYIKECDNHINLPFRLVEGYHWIPRCHLGVGGKFYKDAGMKPKKLKLRAFHYEGLRNKDRLRDKYEVGGRQSPETYGGGRRLKRQKLYKGPHPEFAMPVLEEKGYF